MRFMQAHFEAYSRHFRQRPPVQYVKQSPSRQCEKERHPLLQKPNVAQRDKHVQEGEEAARAQVKTITNNYTRTIRKTRGSCPGCRCCPSRSTGCAQQTSECSTTEEPQAYYIPNAANATVTVTSSKANSRVIFGELMVCRRVYPHVCPTQTTLVQEKATPAWQKGGP